MHSQEAADLLNLAEARGCRIAVAESLTGGLLAAQLISVPGASRVVTGGVIAYDTALKRSLLGVASEVLSQNGPVCEEVALQMARGVRRACRTDSGEPEIGVSTTGVAGPDPDPQTGQPAGTVWIGWSVGDASGASLLRLQGSRAQIRADTVNEALRHLLVNLSQNRSTF